MTRKQKILEALQESPKIPIELEPWEHELLSRYNTNLEKLLHDQFPAIIQVGHKPEDEKFSSLLEKIETWRKETDSSTKEIGFIKIIRIRLVEPEGD